MTTDQPTPDRPYTDADLRTEAARQHYTATTDPDFMGIGEQMADAAVPSTDDGDSSLTWHELLVPEGGGSYEAFGEAQRAIDDLLGKAADVSEWAINLGADGLEPSTEHAISVDTGRPIARIHFAFEPDMPDEMRTALVEGIGDSINDALGDDANEETDESGDSDSDVFDLISDIASRLRDATDSGEYHAVGLIYDLANGRTTVTEARAELAEITFRHV